MQNRYFASDPVQNRVAGELYESVKDLPLICPHGHVDPRLFADPDYQFGSPVDLLIIPDHYVFRMLYSQGISLDELGHSQCGWPLHHSAIIARSGNWSAITGICSAPRRPASGFATNWPMSSGITLKLNAANAGEIYDAIEEKLASDAFRPRALFERFNIEVLATTDAATDTLRHHQAIRDSDWQGRIIPTFRPDAIINIDSAGWRDSIDLLGEVSGVAVCDYGTYIKALEQRRADFKSMGATATAHAALIAYTETLDDDEATRSFSERSAAMSR